jgi:hypothetical protein
MTNYALDVLLKTRDKFSKIIIKHLNDRDDKPDLDNYMSSEEYPHLPKYVLRMIKDINSKMPNNQLENIMGMEQFASGHTDYSSKFALYCAEIYLKEIDEDSIKDF